MGPDGPRAGANNEKGNQTPLFKFKSRIECCGYAGEKM
jgi:hypothetical protein